MLNDTDSIQHFSRITIFKDYVFSKKLKLISLFQLLNAFTYYDANHIEL